MRYEVRSRTLSDLIPLTSYFIFDFRASIFDFIFAATFLCVMNRELLYQLSLTRIPHIGPVQAKILVEHFGTAHAIFTAKETQLKRIEGIGEIRARSIKSFTGFNEAEKEISFIDQYGIQPLFLTDKNYPRRLLNCYDSPTLLFYKGTADLNHAKIVAVIGTRHHTDYGKQQAEKVVTELASFNILVVSGLAFGIDAIAHKASLKNKLPTIGVLAHGLDQIYPSQHASLARDMLAKEGGLLTEFPSHTNPDKHNFPTRNRIVAGMSDATIVIETGIRGGSMITAELANGYNKDVFALPGRTNDNKSIGCNQLIRTNKAILLTEASELIGMMNWGEQQKANPSKQRAIFIELSENEKKLLAILSEKQSVHIDELNLKTGLSNSEVAAAVLSLELQNVIVSLPGKLYQLT
jgi:DNA processing protein